MVVWGVCGVVVVVCVIMCDDYKNPDEERRVGQRSPERVGRKC